VGMSKSFKVNLPYPLHSLKVLSLACADPIQGKGVWSSAYARVVPEECNCGFAIINFRGRIAAAVCRHESVSP
jgi:hypothetical protein